MIPQDQAYSLEKNTLWAITELPGGANLRHSLVDPLMLSGEMVQWRNREASRDVAELEPHTRKHSTYVLQEYFVPARHFGKFVRALSRILQDRKVQAVNVSIRHSLADKLALMPWAKEEVFSLVLFYKQGKSQNAQEEVGVWTREIIDLTLRHDGRYYLPYQLHASRDQFNRAYPEADKLRKLKQRVDPSGKFMNELWARYL